MKIWYQRKIRSRKSKKGRQYNGQKKKYKRTNNDLQNTTQKTNDRATRTPLKTKVELRCSRMVAVPTPHLTPVVSQWPKEKGQTMTHKTLHIKLKIEQHHILIITLFLNLPIHIILSLPVASLNHVLFRGKDSWLHVLNIK